MSDHTKNKVEQEHRPESEAEQAQVRPKSLWAFVNSAFGLWLLSSVALGGGAWLFQEWRDAHAQAVAKEERFQHLNFEVAGRTSQFLSWLKENEDDQHSQTGTYQPDSAPDFVNGAMTIFKDAPRTRRFAFGSLYIQEMLPEFANRDLLSLYGELNLINRESLSSVAGRDTDLQAPCSARQVVKVWSKQERKRLEQRQADYACAMLALVDPRWLIDYKEMKYETFRARFSDTFLNEDIRQFGFPYTK